MIRGWHIKPKVTLPVTIGTIEFRTTKNLRTGNNGYFM